MLVEDFLFSNHVGIKARTLLQCRARIHKLKKMRKSKLDEQSNGDHRQQVNLAVLMPNTLLVDLIRADSINARTGLGVALCNY